MAIESLIEKIVSIASKDSAIVALYLFGSHARGNAKAFSDIDIAVIHNDSAGINRAAINGVADMCGANVQYTYVHINVFNTDNHPLHVSSSIKKEGVLLWQR